jgi:hypothetical protein
LRQLTRCPSLPFSTITNTNTKTNTSITVTDGYGLTGCQAQWILEPTDVFPNFQDVYFFDTYTIGSQGTNWGPVAAENGGVNVDVQQGDYILCAGYVTPSDNHVHTVNIPN